MGACLSSESQHDAGGAGADRQHVSFQDDARAESNDRRRQLGNSKGSSATFSLMRVRSHVVRSVLEPGTGKKQWAAARASTYDHVHEVVLSNFLQDDVDRKAGVCGLINLGNTCFMNSSLQCLMNTIPLTDYFLGYDYRSEINRDNFLGTGGELVTAYASLVKEMWLGKKKAVEPSAFKAKLEAFAPQFYGTEQQDSQELLSCLLDGVHEDLNRVKKKPYIEDKDCDGTNDEGDAVLAWQNYLQRDRSIIVDLFQGQLRNEIRCSECNHTSVKFDALIEEMKNYIAGDPRGPVGTPTIIRAALLAADDVAGARAASVMVQYFVDQAKRKVILPDYRWIAENPESAWTLEDGWMKLSDAVPLLNCEGVKDGVCFDQEEMLEEMYAWQTARLAAAGLPVDRKGKLKTNGLGWRRQGEWILRDDGEKEWMSYGKRVKLSNWNSVIANQRGVRIGNLVHTAYQAAWHEKSAILEAFGVKGEANPKALFGLLDAALKAEGIVVDAPKFTPKEYKNSELRDRSGLKVWGEAWKRVLTSENSERMQERKAAIIADLQNSARKLSLGEVVTIWRHEIHAGRINNAIRIASVSGGAVSAALSLEGAEHCDFMDNKLDATIESVVRAANEQGVDAIKLMGERLGAADESKPNSHTALHGIALVDCPCCMKAIETGMVRRLRADRSKTWASTEMELVRGFNGTNKCPENRI